MIRPATLADVPALLAIYAPFVTDTAITFDLTVPTLAEFTDRFREITAQFPWLVWEEEGRILGYAHASAPFHKAAYQWCAENTIYLSPEAQGRGVGQQLYQALEAILVRQGYQVIYALITESNRRSLEFHKAAGYKTLAHFPDSGFKFEHWHSVIWMEKRLSFVKKPDSTPIPWPVLVNSTKF